MKFDATPSACARILELMENEKTPKAALRISVDSGGCSGFKYDYTLVEQVDSDDFILEKNGAKIAIDPLSRQFMEQCVLEFIEELGGAYFQISNPNATAKCGCGNSFNV